MNDQLKSFCLNLQEAIDLELGERNRRIGRRRGARVLGQIDRALRGKRRAIRLMERAEARSAKRLVADGLVSDPKKVDWDNFLDFLSRLLAMIVEFIAIFSRFA